MGRRPLFIIYDEQAVDLFLDVKRDNRMLHVVQTGPISESEIPLMQRSCVEKLPSISSLTIL